MTNEERAQWVVREWLSGDGDYTVSMLGDRHLDLVAKIERALHAACAAARAEEREAEIAARRAPAASACPERDECLRLRGQPIGMYHCTHCGTMLLAGVDPTPMCPRTPAAGGGEERPR